MIALIAVILLTLTNVATAFVLIRMSKRLIQFDIIFERIGPVLAEYSMDLTKMTNSGLLIDHPEVRTFHRRNIEALQSLKDITLEVTDGKPIPPKESIGKRPEVE